MSSHYLQIFADGSSRKMSTKGRFQFSRDKKRDAKNGNLTY